MRPIHVVLAFGIGASLCLGAAGCNRSPERPPAAPAPAAPLPAVAPAATPPVPAPQPPVGQPPAAQPVVAPAPAPAPAHPVRPEVGQPAPDFMLRTVDGTEVRLSPGTGGAPIVLWLTNL